MKAALIVLPILIICGVVGAAMTGVVDIPGLTPAKKKVAAKKEEPKKPNAKKTPAPPIGKPDKPSAKPKKPEVRTDAAQGDRKLAKLWNEMDTAVLLPIVDKWKDSELAAVLARMSTEKVALLLAQMKPDKASKLSREIRKQASVVTP